MADGEIETFDYVDGLAGLVPHVRPRHVPLGAPIVLGGWALASGPAPWRVVAVVDAARAFEYRGAARPDITRERRDELRAVGYRAVVPTDFLQPGTHHVRVHLVGDDGLYDTGAVSFVVYAGARPELAPVGTPVRVALDQIFDVSADGTVNGVDTAVARGRYALVSGWAMNLHARRSLAGVTATDGEGRRWNAPCSVPRPDIQAVQESLDDRLGFELVIPTRALPRGRHAVHITAYRDDGAVYARGLDASIDIAAAERDFPFFVRDIPDAVRASAQLTVAVDGRDGEPVVLGPAARASVPAEAGLTIEGWALATGAGAPAAAEEVYVTLSLDDRDVPPHRYPAVAAFRRDRPPRALGTPPVGDAWFKASFSTAGLGYRSYRAELLVVDRARRTAAGAPLGTVTIVRPPRS
jgi:hypothetical protein